MMNELKPCPFCGGEAELIKEHECWGHGMFNTSYFVRCKKCGSEGKSGSGYDKEAEQCLIEGIENWNRRADNG